MSFGTSVGDFILLIQLAHKSYRNCKEAGGEYLEIAVEVRSLHSVLRTIRGEAERRDSLIFNAGPEITKELARIADGCKGVLEGIDALLTKYRGLAPGNEEVGKATKLWQRWRFGTEIEDLGKLRWKIITYTSTLAVLLDSIHMKATERVGDIAGRVENQMQSGLAMMQNKLEGFEEMRKAVLFIATRARASERFQAMESVLSLSTYADDDKEVWKQFRSQLISLGFRSASLDRHREVLKAYMMKLDETGVLDEAADQNASVAQSWCGNKSFRMTNLSLLGTGEWGELETGAKGDESGNTVFGHQAVAVGSSDAKVDSVMDASQISLGLLTAQEPFVRRRRRIPRNKVEQPLAKEEIGENAGPETTTPTIITPVEHDEVDVSISNKHTNEVGSGLDILSLRQSRPYAKSYYSVSEAATSQSTLLKETTDATSLASVQNKLRPQNHDRPSSWAGPQSVKDVASAAIRYQRPSLESVDDSDSDGTIRMLRSASRSAKKEHSSPNKREEKVGDWLNPAQQQASQIQQIPQLPRSRSGQNPRSSQQRRMRANDSPTRRKPSSRNNGEPADGRNRGRVESSSSRTNVDFVLPNRPGLQSAEPSKGVETGAYKPQAQDSRTNPRTSRSKSDSGLPKSHLPALAAVGAAALGVKALLNRRSYYRSDSRRHGDSSGSDFDAEEDYNSSIHLRNNANASGPRSHKRSGAPKSRSEGGPEDIRSPDSVSPGRAKPKATADLFDPSRSRSPDRARPRRRRGSLGSPSGQNSNGEESTAKFDLRNSHSPEVKLNGRSVPPIDLEQATKAALIAGATEAFRMRKDTGSWTGDKGWRVLTAAISAGGTNTAAEKPPEDENGNSMAERARAERGEREVGVGDRGSGTSGSD